MKFFCVQLLSVFELVEHFRVKLGWFVLSKSGGL